MPFLVFVLLLLDCFFFWPSLKLEDFHVAELSRGAQKELRKYSLIGKFILTFFIWQDISYTFEIKDCTCKYINWYFLIRREDFVHLPWMSTCLLNFPFAWMYFVFLHIFFSWLAWSSFLTFLISCFIIVFSLEFVCKNLLENERQLSGPTWNLLDICLMYKICSMISMWFA